MTVRPSGRFARRKHRSAQPWSLPRALAPLTTPMDAILERERIPMLSEGNGASIAANDLSQRVLRKCRESVEVKERFFAPCADQIAERCEKMARQFQEGHKLWVMGNGGSACDAQHVAVEFIHPIIEKRRALSALDMVG